MRHDAGGGIDREGHDLLGIVVRDVLDVDAAFGGDHEGYFGGFAIDQDRQIKLLVDLGAFLDVEPVDLLAMRPGLDRDQRGTQHLLGEVIDLGDRLGDAHAALVAGRGFLELALAAAAGVDLALHHPDRTAQRFRGHVGVGSPQHRYPARDRHAEFVQQRLGLIFMDVHLDALRTLVRSIWNSHPFCGWHTIPQELQPKPRRKLATPKIDWFDLRLMVSPISGPANPARSSCRHRPDPAPRRPTCRMLRGPCRPVRFRQCARHPSNRSQRARRHTCP